MEQRQPSHGHHAERDDYKRDDYADAGHAIYTPAVLALYDAWVLGVSNRWIWKCPTPRLLEHYNQHVSAQHLDVGVGTGYFLDRCRWPSDSPQITLLDASPNSLRAAAKRIARYRPIVVQGDVRALPPLAEYASIGLNYVLHCLPGSQRDKEQVIRGLAAHLAPSGVLFGATILGCGAPRGRTAQWLMRRYQRQAIFGNAEDSPEVLRSLLENHLHSVALECVGCVAIFAGRRLAVVTR